MDKSALATQIEGLNLDATIEGRGFLKNRVKKAVQPILLEECSNVVQRSIRDYMSGIFHEAFQIHGII